MSQNYTQVLTQLKSPLAQYVEENISEYLDIILQASDDSISDDEDAALNILNNTDISTGQKRTYIEALQITIESIKMVKDTSLWALLLDTGVAICSEENIMEYFCATKALDKSLINFVNIFQSALNFTEVSVVYGNEKAEGLFDAVAVCNSLENQKYRQILVSLGFTYEDFGVPNISDDKLIVLIDENIVEMNPETLEFAQKNYSGQVLYFIQKHISEYVEMMTTDIFSVEELMEILSWDIADELKIRLLEFTNEKISIIGKNYTPPVCTYILNNNFFIDDLSELFSSFDKWNGSIQSIIFTFSIENVTNIIDTPKEVSESLKEKLIHSEALSKDTKIELLIAMLPAMKEELIKKNLNSLGLIDYIKLFDTRSRPKFEISNTNESLLIAFKESNWIYDYEEDSEREGYYKIVRKRPAKSFPKELL